MGRFFNEKIMNMPNLVVRKLRKSVKVSENRIYGQTKGYLEELRKEFNEPEDEERQKVLDKMAKARAARKNG